MPVETERKVLIIDDDIDFQFMVGTMLRNSGYIVKSVLEGKPGIAMSLARECDIILLDIELPGISGVDLGKQLKSSPDTADIPILLVSGHDECEKLFVESEANDFVQKPFSLSALMLKIHELINKATDFTRQKMAIPAPNKT